MSADAYLARVLPLVERLGEGETRAHIREAGRAIAHCLAEGRKIWIAQTSHCLHNEATYRAGGLIAVHILEDSVLIEAGDCVIEGTPVGTSSLAIDTALEARSRGATVIALTNVAFEEDSRTWREHPSQFRLSEIADIVVDVAGPFGDGVFSDLQPGLHVIPHSGVTEMVAMWMVFADAAAFLRDDQKVPRFYECIMVEGAAALNKAELKDYSSTNLGYRDLVA